ncbi:helix-turn-helix domain-containing protein [Nocardioides panacisoli]|uniref:PucR family transcriptional regulator n=1 Tax=Nocardioides panacisoli TaxID=627624 RepID=UPI001C629AC4|nr:PucR family transcriptional regulator [Nocardioides panacisoli]QYJ05358.1 helix-turn-helix domain-containing protein [Nocardioides panacisoli]
MAQSELAAWLSDFTEEALQPASVEQFVDEIDAEILDAVPEVAADRVLVEELHASTRAHWRNFLVTLADDYRLALPPAAVALSQSIARRHLDINVLLKIYRVANMGVFRHLTERTHADALPEGLPRDEVLVHLWNRAARWIDDSVEDLIDDFTAEVDRLQEGALARREETIEALIAGTDPGPGAEQALGQPLDRWHTAFVLWAAESSSQEQLALSDTAARMCDELDLGRPLTTLAGSREVWGWVSTVTEPVIPEAAAPTLEARGLRVAWGRPAHGVAGFRTTHLQARAAHRLALAGQEPAQRYADLELLALVGEGELTKEMVRREIAGLTGVRRGDEAVRATVLTHLRNGQDVESTARTHFIHPNTVRYRIGKAESALGRRIGDRPAQLEIALAWLAWHGLDALG